MFKSLIAAALLSFSVGAKSIDHREAATTNQSIYVSGSYNLRDSFSFDNDDFDLASYTITFEDISSVKSWLNPMSYRDGGGSFFYLSSLDFNTNNFGLMVITFNEYDVYSNDYFSFSIGDGDSISDLDSDYRDIIINFRNTYILTGDEAKLFDIFFTKEDNIFTTTYNGYYSFNNGFSTYNNTFFLVGGISFNNRIYDLFTTKSDGVLSGLKGGFYDISNNQYYLQGFDLPFNSNYVSSNNVLIGNGKMTKESYNIMSTFGVFAYQKDTSYDDSDWHDLLFSVMDSPIYMISRLLNFELFGINLYIALAGFLTIVVIVFCVRKFL